MSVKESYRFKIWKVVASSHEKSLQRFLVLRRLPFLGSFYLGWVGGYILCTYYQMVDFFMLKFALVGLELQPGILQLCKKPLAISGANCQNPGYRNHIV